MYSQLTLLKLSTRSKISDYSDTIGIRSLVDTGSNVRILESDIR